MTKLGRPRISTVVLTVLFLGVWALYVLVRPVSSVTGSGTADTPAATSTHTPGNLAPHHHPHARHSSPAPTRTRRPKASHSPGAASPSPSPTLSAHPSPTVGSTGPSPSASPSPSATARATGSRTAKVAVTKSRGA
jgi:hypothetical protein